MHNDEVQQPVYATVALNSGFDFDSALAAVGPNDYAMRAGDITVDGRKVVEVGGYRYRERAVVPIDWRK